MKNEKSQEKYFTSIILPIRKEIEREDLSLDNTAFGPKIYQNDHQTQQEYLLKIRSILQKIQKEAGEDKKEIIKNWLSPVALTVLRKIQKKKGEDKEKNLENWHSLALILKLSQQSITPALNLITAQEEKNLFNTPPLLFTTSNTSVEPNKSQNQEGKIKRRRSSPF